jgi:hypothetical protein
MNNPYLDAGTSSKCQQRRTASFTAICKDNDTHAEISSISAHCHASVAPQAAKTNI